MATTRYAAKDESRTDKLVDSKTVRSMRHLPRRNIRERLQLVAPFAIRARHVFRTWPQSFTQTSLNSRAQKIAATINATMTSPVPQTVSKPGRLAPALVGVRDDLTGEPVRHAAWRPSRVALHVRHAVQRRPFTGEHGMPTGTRARCQPARSGGPGNADVVGRDCAAEHPS